jgi:hypothetical protein
VIARFEEWIATLQDPAVTRSVARRILADVETLRPTLTGSQIAESWYVTLMANTALQDEEGACSAASELKRLHREESRIVAADMILRACP